MPVPEDFLPLKPHWFHVLLSLADQDQHGYAIMQEVLDRTGGKVRLWPTTLYGTLKRVIDADLIEESSGRLAAGDDERRRNYRLTRRTPVLLDAEPTDRRFGRTSVTRPRVGRKRPIWGMTS